MLFFCERLVSLAVLWDCSSWYNLDRSDLCSVLYGWKLGRNFSYFAMTSAMASVAYVNWFSSPCFYSSWSIHSWSLSTVHRIEHMDWFIWYSFCQRLGRPSTIHLRDEGLEDFLIVSHLPSEVLKLHSPQISAIFIRIESLFKTRCEGSPCEVFALHLIIKLARLFVPSVSYLPLGYTNFAKCRRQSSSTDLANMLCIL